MAANFGEFERGRGREFEIGGEEGKFALSCLIRANRFTRIDSQKNPYFYKFSFVAYNWSFFVYTFSLFTYSWSLFAYTGKVRLIRALRDCKQRSLNVSKNAPTVSEKASPAATVQGSMTMLKAIHSHTLLMGVAEEGAIRR